MTQSEIDLMNFHISYSFALHTNGQPGDGFTLGFFNPIKESQQV